MRKKILSFALIISMLSGLFAGLSIVANASENTLPVSINAAYCYYDNEGNVKASVRFDFADEAGTAFLGIYDGEKLINVGQDTFPEDKKAKMVKITGVDESYIGYEARIFCWGRENSLIPISLPFTVQVTDYLTELVRRLNAVSDEIDLYTDRSNRENWTIFTNPEKRILMDINTCIDDALKDHADELTADFIKTNYEEEIAAVKDDYDALVAADKDEAFKGRMVSYFTVDNLIWLADTLGLDVAQFGIDKSDYI